MQFTTRAAASRDDRVAEYCDIRSARQLADPQPVTIRVAKFELAPVRRFAGRPTELGLDRVDVAHLQTDQGVGPGITSVLGQAELRPATRDRHERRAAGIEAMFPLLGEAQAFIPPDRHVGVSHAQDRDDFHLHAGMISRPAIRGIQPSGVFAAAVALPAEQLQVPSRTAAVVRAFPDLAST